MLPALLGVKALVGRKKYRYRVKEPKWKKKWKELNEGWKGTVLYCILGICFAILVHSISGILLGTSLPIVTVSSESMVPTLNVGDVVIIKGEEEYNPGDIIVFDGWEDEPIIHRIVAIVEDGKIKRFDGWNGLDDESLKKLAEGKGKIYITKGDNNANCDQYVFPPVEESRIYGKAVTKIPYIGWVKILFVMWFVKDPLFGAMIVVVLGAIYYGYKRWVKK